METTMGRVLTQVTIENLGDLIEVERRSRSSDAVRRVIVDDAWSTPGPRPSPCRPESSSNWG